MAQRDVRSRIVNAAVSRRAAVAAGLGAAAFGLGARPGRVAAQATSAAVPPIVERWAAAWNAHDPAAMAVLFTDDGLYEDLAFGASFTGKDGVAEWVTTTTSFIPDARVDSLAAYRVGDRATAEWVFTGSVSDPAAPDDPAARRPFAVRVASLFELEGDLIRRVTDYYNPTAIDAQVGQPADAATPAA
jgi:steroid delta-isomerase-like uncharacterized protein